MSLLKDFKDFAVKGNMVDLAIGVIIGAAFGRVITSIVSDLIMPLLNPLMPQGHWRDWTIGPGVKLGSFFSTVIDFLIVAIVIFLVVRIFHTHRQKQEAKKAEEAVLGNMETLVAEIRDELRGMRRELADQRAQESPRNEAHAAGTA